MVPTTLDASTVNGGIELELGGPLRATDTVQLDSVNGGVAPGLVPESKATISARCVNGGVHVDGLDISKEEQCNDFERKRRLSGTMNGGGARVEMSTTNGGVHLTRATGEKKSTN